MGLIAFSTIYVAYSLPAIYESSATILIEQQGIPTDFVQTTVNAYAEQLLQTIYQRVVATSKVAEMVERFDLYPDERALTPEEEIFLLFRDSTFMSPQNVETVHARTGREAIITFGFEIAFQYPDPVKARDVAEELSNLFVSYNAELRAETAARTSAFLDTEAAALEAKLAEVAERIAGFKERNAGNLPDDQDVNLRTWERLREELTQVDAQLREIRELKALLEAEIVDTPRYRPVSDESGDPILGGTEQLAEAQQELIRLRGRYSEDHPSIINLRREIASLSASPVNRASMAERIRTELRDRRQQLSRAREAYSDNHPDVVALQRTVDSLERQLNEIEAEIAASASGGAQPNNPLYVQTRTRINAAATELAELGRRRNELRSRVERLDQQRFTAPQVERKFTALVQEQDVLLTRYRDLRALEGEAALGEALETGQSGERLTIVESARLPTTPVSPNRVSLSFLGIVLAIAIGLGVASLTDAMDTTVRGRSDLYQLLEAPPIGIIPYVENTTDTAKRVSINFAIGAVTLGAIAFVISTVLS
jgi:uncharacterized protein involved in exopolysaccharide biosynthesis